jgi:hypothetical protein
VAKTVDRHKRLGIPRRFQIHGHRITVKILTPAGWTRHKFPKGAVGIYDPTTHVIGLRNELGDTEIGQAFCHELVHALLDEMNHKLSFNEVFVDNLGSLLHQALQTFSIAKR